MSVAADAVVDLLDVALLAGVAVGWLEALVLGSVPLEVVVAPVDPIPLGQVAQADRPLGQQW